MEEMTVEITVVVRMGDKSRGRTISVHMTRNLVANNTHKIGEIATSALHELVWSPAKIDTNGEEAW